MQSRGAPANHTSRQPSASQSLRTQRSLQVRWPGRTGVVRDDGVLEVEVLVELLDHAVVRDRLLVRVQHRVPAQDNNISRALLWVRTGQQHIVTALLLLPCGLEPRGCASFAGQKQKREAARRQRTSRAMASVCGDGLKAVAMTTRKPRALHGGAEGISVSFNAS